MTYEFVSPRSSCRVAAALRFLAIWLVPLPVIAAAFAVVFYARFGGSVIGATSHVLLILVVNLALATIPLAIFLVTNSRRTLRLAVLLLSLAVVLLVASVYAAAATGLVFWRRVPTVEMLFAYAQDLPAIVSVVGVSTAALASFIVVFTGLLMATCWYFSGVATKVTTHASESLVTTKRDAYGWVILAQLFTIGFIHFHFAPGRQIDEPVYLLLHPRVIGEHALGRGGIGIDAMRAVIWDGQGMLVRAGKDVWRTEPEMKNSEQKIRDGYTATKIDRRPNIVLITVDALRRDHLGVYGYDRNTSSNLGRLQADGKLHISKSVFSVCAESACGLMSLLNGKRPTEITGNDFGLPEVLSKYGYKRVFILSGDHTNFYGLRQAYGATEVLIDGRDQRKNSVNDDYELLEKVANLPVSNGQPHFFFFHLMSVHGLGPRHLEHVLWTPMKSQYSGLRIQAPEDKEAIRNYYDNGIVQVDAVIAKLTDALKGKGYIDSDTLLLVTADHAEALGERGRLGHSHSLYQEVVAIPWMWIGLSPHSVSDDMLITQADFAPTVLRHLNAPIPSTWTGRPLQDLPPQRRILLQQAPHLALVSKSESGLKKFIVNVQTRRIEYYDLLSDKRESIDLSPTLSEEQTAKYFEALSAVLEKPE